MKARILLLAVCCCFLTTFTSVFAQTAFTYQGQVMNSNSPAHGTYDLTFKLWNASSGGSQVGSTITASGTVITNGLFTVILDFGGQFNGTTYWLELGVRTNGAVSFSTLSPRQQLTPTPYAIFAEGGNAAGLTGSIPSGDLAGVNGGGLIGLNASQLTIGTVPNAVLPADVALLDAASQTFTGVNSFSGNISLLDPTKSITFPATGGANSPMIQMFASGTGNADRMVIAHSPFYPTWGLQYQDIPDRFNFLSGGTPVMSINLGFPHGVGIGITNPSALFEVNGTATVDGILRINDGAGAGYFTDAIFGPWGYVGGEQHSINFDDAIGHVGSLIVGYNGNGYFSVGNLYTAGAHQNNTASFTVFGNGDVNIDPANLNNGLINDGTTNSSGLTFGSGSGEGIASKRTAGGNQYGLDFYTSFTKRLSVYNAGGVSLNGNPLLLEPSTAGGFANDELVWGNGGLPGINFGDGPFLAGYYGGALGGLSPNTVCLSWDYSGDVWVSNNLSTATLTIRGGADLAEPFNINSGNGQVSQGAVVVIDDRNPGHLKLSDQPYDTRVAGVVSGANGVNPGIQMHQQGLIEGGRNVALSGRVYVQADASVGAIRPGDMLTTSSAPGYAMKVSDHARAAGAILGKAMTGLSEGKGMVLVLVTLQ